MSRNDATPVAPPVAEQGIGEARSELRYLALARLTSGLSACASWEQVAASVSHALGELGPEPGVRLWVSLDKGPAELARHPRDHNFEPIGSAELEEIFARSGLTSDPGHSRTMAGIDLDGISLGAIEICGAQPDPEVLSRMIPVIALRVSLLVRRGLGGVRLAPRSSEPLDDTSYVIHEFAHDAKRVLDHDRLNVYLLTPDGRAFERFASAPTSNPPADGVLIPFEDVGLRHVVAGNKPLVSSDLSADPRILGQEDRVIAQAGFRGLLSVPLRRSGRPFGVLSFISHTPGFYRQEDVPVAEQIASQISAFIEDLRHQRQIRALARHEAHESERNRIARDLYQAIALATPKIAATAAELEDELRSSEPGAAAKAAGIRATAESALTDVRRAIADIAPRGQDGGDLHQLAQTAVNRLRERLQAEIKLQAEGSFSNLPRSIRLGAFRILQESLLNATVHSEASSVLVTLSADRDLNMTVSDDGRGFDLAAASGSDGLGLRHIRERAQALGGFVTIESAQGRGTTVSLVVPSTAAENRAASSAPAPGSPERASSALRIVVAAGNSLLLSGLSRVIERGENLRVVGEARTGPELRARVRQLMPDTVILSTDIGEADLELLIAGIHDDSPDSALLAVAESGSGSAAELISLGAGGVVDRSMSESEILDATRAVAGGAIVVRNAPMSSAEAALADSLNDRERQILGLLANGETNAEIGERLYLATKTVERQVAAIIRKMGARNRAHAAAIGAARGAVRLSDPG